MSVLDRRPLSSVWPKQSLWVVRLVVACAMLSCRLWAEEPHATVVDQYTRKITTSLPAAQVAFDDGLAYLYSFNHDEAIRSFRNAAQQDPNSAMIQWAIALAHGPHINFPLVDEAHAAAAWEALGQAKKLSATASPVERDLIQALESRYAMPQPEDRRPLDLAYAAAMRNVWHKYPDDADVGALFAEALMDLWPWDLWSAAGEMKEDTAEILQTLEKVLALQPDHPLALHLYIHSVEGSPYPERAALAAECLRDLTPQLGHLVHMPSHIDVRLGHWQRAIEANEKAIRADAAYRAQSPEQDFFRTYMAHNWHMLAFAAMMQGESQRATDAIRKMLAEIPEAWLAKNAVFVDGAYAMPYEMHLRFGRWDEMLAEPEPPELLRIARTFRLFARGVAFAAKGLVPEARAAQRAFVEAMNKLPAEATFVMNPAAKVLAVAEAMLEGEILYREGKVDEAVASLTDAVRLEEELRYIEPPDWIQPVRHVLGATLMDAKRYTAAEAVYRADLVRHPHNGWSLHGLAQSLQAQNRSAEADAVRAQFDRAWIHADIQLTSSCFCLPDVERSARD